MKKIIYLLAMLFCFAACKKQQVDERMAITRVSFLSKTLLSQNPTIKYGNKNYNILDQIPTTLGDNKVEILDGVSGAVLIDTILNIKGPQDFYIYQPFDIVPPVIVDSLPLHPPVDPRNPLKNEPPAPEGYLKVKIALKTQFILPNQSLDIVVLSTTAASPTVALPVETLHGVKTDYNTTLFQIKRPVLADGSLSTIFSFSLIDPVTGQGAKNKGGTTFTGGTITLPIGQTNLYMFYLDDALFTGRNTLVAFPTSDGKLYSMRSNLLWSIE